MMRRLAGIIGLLVLLGCPSSTPTQWGEAVPEEGVQGIAKVVDKGVVGDAGAAGDGRETAVVRGTVEDVCPHAGCWFIIRDGREELYVDLEGGAHFTVPRSLKGHRVRVAGRVDRDGAEVRLIGTGVVVED